MKKILFVLVVLVIAGCDKYGAGGYVNRMIGDWSQVRLPEGCKPKQIASEESSGVVLLCDDGRIFH